MCAATEGSHSIEWSKLMTGWDHVLSFEAQERLYYAVAGNIALNNCFNVKAIHAAVGNTDGSIRIPKIDYSKPSRYGSAELKQRPGTEFIGQPINYAEADLVTVPAIRLAPLRATSV
jgi:FkbM family methyltransferase